MSQKILTKVNCKAHKNYYGQYLDTTYKISNFLLFAYSFSSVIRKSASVCISYFSFKNICVIMQFSLFVPSLSSFRLEDSPGFLFFFQFVVVEKPKRGILVVILDAKKIIMVYDISVAGEGNVSLKFFSSSGHNRLS